MLLFAAIALVSSPLWVVVLMALTGTLLLSGRRVVTGTTLVGPWWWMQASLGIIGGAHLVVACTGYNLMDDSVAPTGRQAAFLFAAAASSFCPLMSLLGAKRPQDRGWHFVVLSLWAILVLPAAESLILRHGQMPDVRGARSWFMLILIGLGIVNALPTRFWFPATMFGAGQLLMLATALPLLREFFDVAPTLAGFGCCAMGGIAASLLACGQRKRHGSLDAVWLDFRDAFGLVWGLRVAEQINSAARASNWPLALRWRGFIDARGETLDWSSLPEETRKSLQQVTENLLRRFVSQKWIAARTDDAIH